MGKLYIVPTPIGNLKDLSLRAIEVLKNSSYIACESCMKANKLLRYYKIEKPLISYRDSNEDKVSDILIEKLKTEGAFGQIE